MKLVSDVFTENTLLLMAGGIGAVVVGLQPLPKIDEPRDSGARPGAYSRARG